MTYALVALLAAVAVWATQRLVRWWRRVEYKHYSRIIASPDHSDLYYRIEADIPDDCYPQITVHKIPKAGTNRLW